MDPFVVISFGKKVFRTRVIRHSLQPVWEEKLLFHVRRYETAFQVQLTVLDWDKLSSNDHIGDANFSVTDLVESAPQPDPVTGLYNKDNEDHPMTDYSLRLSPAKETPWEAKYNPVITFRYMPFLLHVLKFTSLVHQCQIPTIRCPATTFLAPVSQTVRY
jgi:phosphatidylserine decarboxylase